MAKKKRRQYSDDFRASAVLMLESQGYPGTKGALTAVAGHLHVPESTLRSWASGARNPVSAKKRELKKRELKELIRDEIYNALAAVDDPRLEASYKDLITGAAILIDKLQLLDDKPTARVAHEHDDWRSEAIEYIKNGEVTYTVMADEFGTDLAVELFRLAGVPVET
ncbi:MAG: transposase [Planctomycetota bacterium]